MHVLNYVVSSLRQVVNFVDFLLQIGIKISCVCLKFPHMQFITLPRVAWFLNGSQEVSEWEGTLGF